MAEEPVAADLYCIRSCRLALCAPEAGITVVPFSFLQTVIDRLLHIVRNVPAQPCLPVGIVAVTVLIQVGDSTLFMAEEMTAKAPL